MEVTGSGEAVRVVGSKIVDVRVAVLRLILMIFSVTVARLYSVETSVRVASEVVVAVSVKVMYAGSAVREMVVVYELVTISGTAVDVTVSWTVCVMRLTLRYSVEVVVLPGCVLTIVEMLVLGGWVVVIVDRTVDVRGSGVRTSVEVSV